MHHISRNVIAAALATTLTMSASVATAGVDFIEIQTTLIALAEGVNPGAKILVSDEGEVVLVSVGMDGARLLPVELGEGAEEIVYAFQDSTVVPVSWTFGPQGDILLRGNALISDDETMGVTARIGIDGELKWEQPDSTFAETEEFLGRYQAPAGPVVWSPIQQRVLVFTTSDFDIAPVSQGTMLFEFDGAVRVPSVTFGTQYIGAVLANALRTPEGKYLVYYFAQNDVGARFFIYDGRETMTNWEVEGDANSWDDRIVYVVKYDTKGNLILLWNELEDAGDSSKSRLSSIAPDGSVNWEVDLAGAIDVTDMDGNTESAALNRPVFMVTATDEIVLLRSAGPGFFFDIRDSEDGSPLGFFDFGEITDRLVFDLAFLNGSESEYLLTTVDPEDPTTVGLLQVKLDLNDEPVVIDTPASNGTSGGTSNGATLPEDNNGPISGGNEEEEMAPPEVDVDVGCGCEQVPARPFSPLPLLIGAGAALFLTRRRS